MRELDVVGVRVEMPSQPTRSCCCASADGDRYLPIWIGAVEATAIAFAQQGVVPPRPLTHDLLKDVLDGARPRRSSEVRITELRDGVFYADLVFDGDVEVSARPSDAIALALRTGTRIFGSRGGPGRGRRRRARRGGGRGREVPRVPRPDLAGGLRRRPAAGSERRTLNLKLRVRVDRADCDTRVRPSRCR